MDKIKEAFDNIKEDIDYLIQEIDLLNFRLDGFWYEIERISKKMDSTHRQIIPTYSTHPSTHEQTLEALKTQNMPISTGNEGVSTDRQTDRQTHKQTDFGQNMVKNSIENASEILDSLDNIKREIRLKFKRLTEQEMLIFSTIYQLEEEQGQVDYKILSRRLNLTESSIRDYVGRLIKKGIPVEKKKIKNKNIQLSISSNLKKIATLSTILQLRDL